MAAVQEGTGGFTVGGQAAAAAAFITVPAASVVESVTSDAGGSPIFEDYVDEDGAFHTRITFEKTMGTATVVIFGAAYASASGALDGSSSNYYVESAPAELTKGPQRTTITLTRLPTIA